MNTHKIWKKDEDKIKLDVFCCSPRTVGSTILFAFR